MQNCFSRLLLNTISIDSFFYFVFCRWINFTQFTTLWFELTSNRESKVVSELSVYNLSSSIYGFGWRHEILCNLESLILSSALGFDVHSCFIEWRLHYRILTLLEKERFTPFLTLTVIIIVVLVRYSYSSQFTTPFFWSWRRRRRRRRRQLGSVLHRHSGTEFLLIYFILFLFLLYSFFYYSILSFFNGGTQWDWLRFLLPISFILVSDFFFRSSFSSFFIYCPLFED